MLYSTDKSETWQTRDNEDIQDNKMEKTKQFFQSWHFLLYFYPHATKAKHQSARHAPRKPSCALTVLMSEEQARIASLHHAQMKIQIMGK